MEDFLKDAVVVDLETTGLDFATCEIIELSANSAYDVVEAIAGGNYNEVTSEFFKPRKPIEPEVSAINGITNRMVDESRYFDECVEEISNTLCAFKYLVAHNAFYDYNVLKAQNVSYPTVICTLRMARKLFADDNTVTKHTLSYLRYRFDLPIDDKIIAHRAGEDVVVTTALFLFLVQEAISKGLISGEGDIGAEIVAWLDEPIVTTIMPFGKHKDKKMVDIPLSYWQWGIENMDSLQEGSQYYDADFAASVALAIEEIFEKS